MRLRVSGPGIADPLAAVIASLTNKARLNCASVEFDEAEQIARLRIRRHGLIRMRRVLPDKHDHSKPIDSVVTVRNVVSCDIVDSTRPELGGHVHLLFGIQLEGDSVYVSSAEEDKGQTCYSITLKVSELDIEIADIANSRKGGVE